MVRCFNIPAVVMAAACGATLGAAAGAARASTQNVTIEAVDANGATVSEAVCDIANRQGAWRVVTPAVAQITAGGEWLKVKCAKGFGLAGASTSIDTTQLSPPRANAMPGTLRQLGGTPAVKVRVVMRDTAGAAPALPGTSESQIVQAMPVPSAVVAPVLAPVTAIAAPAELQSTAASAAPVVAAGTVSPPAARIMDVHDVNAVPHLSAAGREAYFHFLRYPLPRAFAISKNGGWGFGVRGGDPRKMALDNCERRGGPCEIVVVDQQVVLAAGP